ncbi:3-oxoacyl-[acyl-carrier protein] reductase [Novosphingobium sp. PhB165]|uniref:SDR family NAD(P)-dependent oxidoreductase n=1 Tax=Novosphingobium sp. PhB165 TaxID=2485105 RepID=UPI00104E2D98|nr:SDR family NAD(P)-dependent oxidoreductase [Novosphingobium sp. PhB165]TCM22279.1 3-oxoacyl-[acyl-carrier protein] reductase [Novosphingobium sp. PhB165]
MIEGFDLTGRAALVTGGGTGIGKEVARLLAQRGADVMLVARRADRLEAAAREIAEETGRRVASLSCDVTDADAATAMVQEAADRLGRLDVLINNAGMSSFSALSKMAPELWDKDVRLNLNAAFYVSHAAIAHLKAHGNGAVVNVSSLAGINGTVGCGAYSAAKAGLQMFTRVAAAEWGPAGVRVNCVAPGMIATELAKRGWAKVGFDATDACKVFPLRRPGTPLEVAQAIAFLASDAASYNTGETLTVGGGPQLKGMIDAD